MYLENYAKAWQEIANTMDNNEEFTKHAQVQSVCAVCCVLCAMCYVLCAMSYVLCAVCSVSSI